MSAPDASEGPWDAPSLNAPPWFSTAAHVLLLPLLVALERLLYYGTRAILILYLIDGLGMETADAYPWYATATWLISLTPLPGALVALVVGPHAAVVAGALLMALGYATMGLGGEPALTPAFVLLAVGSGLYKPAVWALIGVQLFSRDSGRTALLIGTYGALNVAAFLGPLLTGQAQSALNTGFEPIFGFAGMGCFVVSAVAAGLWALSWNTPRVPLFTESVARRFAAGLLVVPAAFGLWWMMTPISALVMQSDGFWSFNLNPLTIVVVALVLVPLLIGAEVLETPIPAMPVIGGGLIVALLGAFLWIDPIRSALGWPAIAVGTVVLAIAEVLISGGVLARITGGVPARASVVLVALWMMSSNLAGTGSQWLANTLSPEPMMWIGMALTGASAMAILALWKPLDWVAFEWEPDDQGDQGDQGDA